MGSLVVTGKRGIYLRSGLSPKIQATPLLFFGRLLAQSRKGEQVLWPRSRTGSASHTG